MSDASFEPRVSVLLPVHQGGPFLDEAIDSVLAQTWTDFELLLIDDGATDDTPQRIAARCDPRIRAVRNPRNEGLIATLNRGLSLARGELVARMDADDVSLPDRLAKQVAYLDAYPEIGACGGQVETLGDRPGRRLAFPTHPDDVRAELLLASPLAHPTVCLRRELFAKHGLRFDPAYPHAEDYDLWRRAAALFPLANLPDVLLRYREHDAGVSRRHAAEQRESVARIHRELLARLGVDPTPRELAIHAGDPAEMAEIEAWLLRLREANASRGTCPQPALERALARRWHKSADRCLSQGRRAARRFLRSPLATPLPLRARLRVAARSVALALRPGRALRAVLPDAMGGVTSYLLDLSGLASFQRRGMRLLWLRGEASDQTPAERAGGETVAHRWPQENLFHVLRRMHRRLRRDRGPIVASEFFGLAYAARHGGRAPVVQILHGDIPMYYRLAHDFEPWVDAFVAVSSHVAEELARRLPARAADIHHLPSAVPTAERRRVASDGPLRLIYTGRLDAQKGVLDLPEIDRLLRAQDVPVVWTVIGSGPEEAALQEGFDAEACVDFAGTLPLPECRARLADHDVLVLPSYGEGLPISLLEAMAAGVVPVVSDLESGIREVIDDGATGLLARPGEPAEFAGAIARLHRQRGLLEDCSRAAAERARGDHDLAALGDAWLGLVRSLEAKPPRRKPVYRRGPSRLDRPLWPNVAVRLARRWNR